MQDAHSDRFVVGAADLEDLCIAGLTQEAHLAVRLARSVQGLEQVVLADVIAHPPTGRGQSSHGWVRQHLQDASEHVLVEFGGSVGFFELFDFGDKLRPGRAVWGHKRHKRFPEVPVVAQQLANGFEDRHLVRFGGLQKAHLLQKLAVLTAMHPFWSFDDFCAFILVQPTFDLRHKAICAVEVVPHHRVFVLSERLKYSLS